MREMKIHISVVGLGKLGTCMVASFASKGFQVLGLDSCPEIVESLKNGQTGIQEPMLDHCLKAGRDFLQATCSYDDIIRESDVTFLVVPTPSTASGKFSDQYLKQALESLSLSLKKSKKEYHVFVITSTVSPGTVESSLIPCIESFSGRVSGRDFSVCYNPEFIALGSVIHDLLNPDFVLIGENDVRAGRVVENIYRSFCENNPVIERMNITSAEITKISLNCYVTMKISFANSLMNICDNIPTADIDNIIKALGRDKRISSHYLRGGLSYGGPCFPRDNRAFLNFAKEAGIDAKLARATDEINDEQIDRLVDNIVSIVPDHSRTPISVLGVSYKPGTHIIDESAGVKIIEKLIAKGISPIYVYDPLASKNVQNYFGKAVHVAESLRAILRQTRVCVIATPDTAFHSITDDFFETHPVYIFDKWRILRKLALSNKVRYIG